MTDLAEGVRKGDRRSLAQAITLVESTRPDHQHAADELLTSLLPLTGTAHRIGISGPPGVGKSTFIEAFGLHILDQGLTVAVLAVDPSSSRSGGSILGDKTRMELLGRRPEAFIRPSPSGQTLGGIARNTREALLLCEAAGYDVVVVETVGVGQSEVSVADMVDLFCVLLSPGGGDELQGIKRGIMELADILVVNKADGDLKPAAGRARADVEHAVHLLRPRWAAWSTRVLACSALANEGVAAVWSAAQEFRQAIEASGELRGERSRQAVAWMWSEVDDALTHSFRQRPEIAAQIDGLEEAVSRSELAPRAAARALLGSYERSSG